MFVTRRLRLSTEALHKPVKKLTNLEDKLKIFDHNVKKSNKKNKKSILNDGVFDDTFLEVHGEEKIQKLEKSKVWSESYELLKAKTIAQSIENTLPVHISNETIPDDVSEMLFKQFISEDLSRLVLFDPNYVSKSGETETVYSPFKNKNKRFGKLEEHKFKNLFDVVAKHKTNLEAKDDLVGEPMCLIDTNDKEDELNEKYIDCDEDSQSLCIFPMHRQKYGVGFYRGLYARRYSAPTILDMNMSKHNKNLDEREAAIKQINKFVFRFIPFQDQSPIWPECLFIIGPKESETHSGKMIRYNDCENLSRYRMSDNKIPNIVCIPTTLEEAISYNGKSKGFAELENLVYMSPEAKIPIEQRKETGGSVVICPIVDKTTSLVSMRKNQDKHGRNVKAQDSFARKAGNSFWYRMVSIQIKYLGSIFSFRSSAYIFYSKFCAVNFFRLINARRSYHRRCDMNKILFCINLCISKINHGS